MERQIKTTTKKYFCQQKNRLSKKKDGFNLFKRELGPARAQAPVLPSNDIADPHFEDVGKRLFVEQAARPDNSPKKESSEAEEDPKDLLHGPPPQSTIHPKNLPIKTYSAYFAYSAC
ncbi:MAG: hypothetical protein PHQ18_01105 [Patescibacteria group bacterium]|nr:hypothetical protein [Patescibacteria group bacterium]